MIQARIVFLLLIVMGCWTIKDAHAQCADPTKSPPCTILVASPDVTPWGSYGHRPATVKIDNYIYLIYREDYPTSYNRLVKLDVLDYLKAKTNYYVYSGYPSHAVVTDVRMCIMKDDPSERFTFWYPFEMVYGTHGHWILLARYSQGWNDPGGTFPTFDFGSLYPSQRSYIERYYPNNPIPPYGQEVLDDPLPYRHNNKNYVLTRHWGTAAMTVHVFNDDLYRTGSHSLDLSSAMQGTPYEGFGLSVGSIVDVDGSLYFVAAAYNGPPPPHGTPPLCQSDLVAIRLNNDLTAPIGQLIQLTDTLSCTSDEYEYYVPQVKYENGKIYVLYTLPQKGMLKIFDNNFENLETIHVHSATTVDLHTSIEFGEGEFFVFYYTNGYRIIANVYVE